MRRAPLIVLALTAGLSGAPLPASGSETRADWLDASILPLLAGVGAMAASVALLVLAAVRRGRAVGPSASDERVARLRQRTARLGRIRLDDEPIASVPEDPPERGGQRRVKD